MGDASYPIAPLSGVPGEPTFHSGHPVFRRDMRTYHGGRAQACVCLCWALSSLEDPVCPLMECPRMLGKTAWLRTARFLCSHAAAHRGGGGEGGAAFRVRSQASHLWRLWKISVLGFRFTLPTALP